MYDEYNKDDRGHNTRRGQQYTCAREVGGEPPQHFDASISYEEGTQVVSLHSYCAIPRPPRQPSRFWETLRSFNNVAIWKYFLCDRDCKWICQELLMGSLAIMHDGSYMKEVEKDVCSTAFMLYCRITKNRCKGAAAERSQLAYNYQAEILRGDTCATGAVSSISTAHIAIPFSCDGM